MENAPVNLCEKCPIGQNCCNHLTGLKLTEREFNELFTRRRDLLIAETRTYGDAHFDKVKG